MIVRRQRVHIKGQQGVYAVTRLYSNGTAGVLKMSLPAVPKIVEQSALTPVDTPAELSQVAAQLVSVPEDQQVSPMAPPRDYLQEALTRVLQAETETQGSAHAAGLYEARLIVADLIRERDRK